MNEWQNCLDGQFLPYERFPQRLRLVLLPIGDEAARVLVAPRNGQFRSLHGGMQDLSAGDGFRWALAIHTGFAVHLGWSPVLRDLLGLKRRSSRVHEKAEDGVRAQMIADAITVRLFTEERESLVRGETISDNLLEEVRDLASAYEVRTIPAESWIQAISSGFSAWSTLARESGGILDLDFRTNSLQVQPLPPSPKPQNEAQLTVSPRTRHVNSAVSPNRGEKLPPKLTFLLQETKPGVAEIFLELEDGGFVNIGSKAEEWSHGDEGFRWHDIFHLANFGILGWSPVTEALAFPQLGKGPRWSLERGLRAQMMEEALVAVALQIAREDIALEAGVFVPRLQRWIEALTRHYEVGSLSSSTWQSWCSEAFRLWREIREHGGGFIDVDLDTRQISFRPTPWRSVGGGKQDG